MNIKLITAIFPRDKLEAVEKKLQVIGVERIDVSKVKGYGEYRNYYQRDWMVDEVKLDLGLLPCAAMCALGLCMSRMGGKGDAAKNDGASKPASSGTDAS